VTLALGAAISVAAFLFVRDRDEVLQRLRFEQRAREIAAALEKGFDAPLEVLTYLPPFFESSQYVSPEEFRHFTEPALARFPGIEALEWAPRVRVADRDAFVAARREELGGEFDIIEPGADGELLSASWQEEYFPLLYREPPDPRVRGLDLFHPLSTSGVLARALESGAAVVSGRFTLVQEDGPARSIGVYAPIFNPALPATTPDERRAALRGIAAAILRVDPIVEDALADFDLANLDVALRDLSAPPGDQLLWDGGANADAEGPSWSQTLAYRNRQWSIDVRAASGAGAGLAAQVLAGGLSVAIVLSGALAAASAISRLRRQIEAARKLGQYQLVRRIGKGGMGEVYRARHALLRRPTAIKLISADSVSSEALERFEREVRYTSELQNPHTIAIYDYGRTPEGVFYYAMEYLEGLSLDELARRCGPQPAARVMYLLRQVCGSLAEAHAKGVVHRDIKPANIMVCERGGMADVVKVLDFGLVKQVRHDLDPELSTTDALLGTPKYIAPESLTDPERVGAPTDLYALAAVAYLLLVGQPVFDGKTAMEVCGKHLNDAPVAPNVARPGSTPASLERILLRCLEKDPDARPRTAAELLELLDACDDVPEWTQREARRWWETQGRDIARDLAEAGETVDEAVGDAVAVDLDKRRRRDRTA
jgi:CHASE1-domain containing sensor protein